jgi:crotonobetainyl-CoA:carnitine CoA-transferase CaiB-like acyl-CoA transferase
MRDALQAHDPTVDGLSYDWFSEQVREGHRRLTDEMESAFRTKSTSDWIALLDAADVPCAPVHFPEEIFEHPHVEANELMVDLQHEILGPMRMPACPIHMSGTPATAPSAPPALGAHGRKILREHGYDDAAIDELIESGVVVTRERLLERERAERAEEA